MTLIVDDERKQSSKGHAPIRYELVNTGVIGIDRLLRYNIRAIGNIGLKDPNPKARDWCSTLDDQERK